MNALVITAVIFSAENGITVPFLLIMLFIFMNLLAFLKFYILIMKKYLIVFQKNKKVPKGILCLWTL